MAEQWGRRWITIDTSRVALALARTRHHGRPLPLLHPDRQPGRTAQGGRDLTTHPLWRTRPTATSGRGSFTSGCPHITLRDIANNAEIDVIYEDHQEKLEPLRGELNKVLETEWEELGDSPRSTRPVAKGGCSSLGDGQELRSY